MILRIVAAVFMLEVTAAFAIANDKPLFAMGTWDLELDADYTQPIRFSDEEMFGGEIALGYYLFDNFSINVTAAGFGIDQTRR